MAERGNLVGIFGRWSDEEFPEARGAWAEAKLLAKRPAEMRAADKTILARNMADRLTIAPGVQ